MIFILIAYLSSTPPEESKNFPGFIQAATASSSIGGCFPLFRRSFETASIAITVAMQKSHYPCRFRCHADSKSTITASKNRSRINFRSSRTADVADAFTPRQDCA